ncbi:MAG: TauD/TfdA family dioxygenase [Zoogloeaceae bacterium]|jgi:taurine dioxygenase|nr:TauD/TfdA family dioxygenase [Zoogloeaceae bacterium]
MSDPLPFTKFQALAVTPNIGAEIRGLDLSASFDAQTEEELRLALARHGALFFRKQTLTPDQHVRVARIFGNPSREKTYFPAAAEHELVELVETKANGPRYNTDQWHSDSSYLSEPPAGAVLVSRVLPEAGGDTVWSSGKKVYQSLPAALAQWIETLDAQHSLEHSGWPEILRRQSEDAYRESRARHIPVSHPLVQTDALTGEKYIFVNPKYTERVNGLSRRQSDALLGFLFAQFERPEHQARLRWEAGTVAIWDNYGTNHYAVPDYLPNYRLLHRVTF